MKTARATRDAALPFLEALRASPEAAAQTRLLNTSDRDLGAVLLALEEEERAEVYRIVGERKALRLREEVERMRHVSLDSGTIRSIATHLSSHLSSDRPKGHASRYFRPKRTD